MDSRLKESLRLIDDPALRDPVHVPWLSIGIAAAIFCAGALALILRARKRAPAAAVAPMPTDLPEDALAALDAVWSAATEARIVETLEGMSSIMRRYLGRQLLRDVAPCTTAQLSILCSSLPGFYVFLEGFFKPGDLIRFAGLPASLAELEAQYETARGYIVAGEARRNPPTETRQVT